MGATHQPFQHSKNDTVTSIIKLCAPNQKDIDCRFFLTQNFSLENSSPLSGVTFNMFLKEEQEEGENADAYSKLPSEEKETYAKRMMKLLGAVHMVNYMRLSPGFLEVLSQAPDLLDCQPPLLCNLQSLVLEMWCTRGCLRAIAYLLSISPDIDTIYLESKQSNLADVGDDWEVGLSFPGMLSHLEYVQIEEVEGCDAEFKILRFLKKNATILKNVALYFRSCVGSPDRVRQVEQFRDKLRAVPTASSSIELVFN
ncbi:hypothetical protein MKW98_014974 [Papaver atlanticum]|uniref:FBD domain-containing protein n=1 Tax=Papaver atlanticum TaxID=357466 RepID=A0AAD4SQ33_9MAGN|nr:hypothetical protein MKW98_014974 [Papaver atlanticum]